MSGNIELKDMVAAIASAVVEAQDTVEKHQTALLSQFFDEQGRVKTVSLRVPSSRPHAKPGEEELINVPLLALTGTTRLSIRDLEIDADITLGNVATLNEDDNNNEDYPEYSGPAAERPSRLKSQRRRLDPLSEYGRMPKSSLGVDMSSTSRDETATKAHLKIKISAAEPTEGMSRLMVELNKKLFSEHIITAPSSER